jgi:hypothetical protein
MRYDDDGGDDEDETDGENSCVIIGPSQSGKTFLLLAIGRACFIQGKDAFSLEFIPKPTVSDLMKRSVKIITGKEKVRYGSTRPEDFSFEIHASAKVLSRSGYKRIFGIKRTIKEAISMTVCDGPGGALFVDEVDTSAMREQIRLWQPHLERRVRNARTLILCVDASGLTSAKSDQLETDLPDLISKASRKRPQITEEALRRGTLARYWWRLKNRFLQLLRRPVETEDRLRRSLKADRVLLLLNKVDRLCHNFDRPDYTAKIVDPVGQAREMLGVPLLNMIRHSLKPDATFAAGVTSALGFHPINGRPIANEEGQVDLGRVQEGESILRQWTPFGVRDALFFITTGHATGTVKLITPRNLEVSDKDEAIRVFPYRADFTNTDSDGGGDS